MNKSLLALLCVLALLLPLASCGGKKTPGPPVVPTKQATVEGSIFGGVADDKIAVSVPFDPAWLTTGSNTAYNPSLAEFCAVMSADSYFRQKDLDKGRQNRVVLAENDGEDYLPTSFLTSFGFTDAAHYESYLVQTDPTDSNDSVTLNIGHQVVDGKYDVFAVVIRGCFSFGEWCSAFDPGCGDEAYEELTGAHPEWTHGDYFKGFDVAANRALGFISDFIAEYGDVSLPDAILLTGHSRGGAIANLLGAHYETDDSIRSYTYTFNAPPVAVDADAANYKTIFNIFDESDFFVDPFPFGESGFSRFGSNISLPVATSDEAKAKIAALTGREDYSAVPSEVAAEYRRLFAALFPSRAALCRTKTITVLYDSVEEATAGRDAYLALVGSAGLALGSLCPIGEVTDAGEGKYSVTVEYSGLTLLRTFAEILAYGTAATDAVLSLFAGDEAACRLASLISDNAAAVNGGHLLINSYVVAGMAVKDE